MLRSLRRYDNQARWASILAIVSVAPFVVAVWLVFRNFHSELGQIVYGAQGKFVPLFLASVLFSSLPAVMAFVLGWSSAGQRRNDKQARSWLGFFLGGSVVTLDIVLMLAFYMLRLQTA